MADIYDPESSDIPLPADQGQTTLPEPTYMEGLQEKWAQEERDKQKWANTPGAALNKFLEPQNGSHYSPGQFVGPPTEPPTPPPEPTNEPGLVPDQPGTTPDQAPSYVSGGLSADQAGGISISGSHDPGGLGAATARLGRLGGEAREAVAGLLRVLGESGAEQERLGQALTEQEKSKYLEEQAIRERAQNQVAEVSRQNVALREIEMAKAQKAESEFISIQRDLDSFEVRPMKGFNLASKILMTLGSALGAYAATQGRTPNYAAQIVENAVKQDMEAQKLEYDTLLKRGQMADNLYAKCMQRYNNTFQAEAATVEGIHRGLDFELGTVSTQYAGRELQIKADLAREANRKNQAVNANKYKADVIKTDMAITQAQANIAAKRASLSIQDRARQQAQDAAAQKGVKVLPQGYRPKGQVGDVQIRNMPEAVWQKHAQKVTKYDEFISVLKQVKKMRQDHGAKLIPWDDENMKKANSLLNRGKVIYKDLSDMGASLTGIELEILNLPSSAGAWGNVEEQIGGTIDNAIRARKGFLSSSPLEEINPNIQPSDVWDKK